MPDGTENLDKAKRKQSPAAIAERLLEHNHLVTDHADTTFRWNGAHWVPLSKPELRQIVHAADGGRRSSGTRRTEIIEQLKAHSFKADLVWGRVADYEIPFENGVLDVRSGELRQHRPADYLERVLPWKWSPHAECQAWLATLDSWGFDAGDESGKSLGGEREALQEFFGYCCMSHAKYKKALLIFGESDTGKSVVTYVLGLMVGRTRCCTLPLEQMNDPQARAVIVGKAINLITEIDSHALIADGGFKALISTEEPVLINAKYKEPIDYWPTAKHVFLTNNLPRLNDRTEAVLNRLLIVQFARVFNKEEQDDALQDKLAAEIPGVIAWAVEGAKRLIAQRGKFTDPLSSAAALGELRRRANPAIEFVQERLEVAELSAIPLVELVKAFNAWNQSGKRVGARGLGDMLRKAGHVVKNVHFGRDADGKKRQAKSLVGFRLGSGAMPGVLIVGADALTSDAADIDGTNPADAAGAANG
jgi:putative DNA primase/helicase